MSAISETYNYALNVLKLVDICNLFFYNKHKTERDYYW